MAPLWQNDKIDISIGENIKETTEDTVDGMCEVVRKFLTKKNLLLSTHTQETRSSKTFAWKLFKELPFTFAYPGR